MMTVTAKDLLGHVLREARETIDRSPEQVAQVAGTSGRTIRRLEEGQYDSRPRAVTLDALSTFYGLRSGFVRELADWGEARDDDVLQRLAAAAAVIITDEVHDVDAASARDIAMRLARASRAASAEEQRETGASAWWGRGDAHQALYLATRHGDDRAAEASALLTDFLALDRGRRRMVSALVRDLRRAREHQRHGEQLQLGDDGNDDG